MLKLVDVIVVILPSTGS